LEKTMSLEYSAPREALSEARRRLDDPALQEQVDDYLGSEWPSPFTAPGSEPAAVYAPYMLTGNQTEVNFVAAAQAAGANKVIVATYRDIPWSKGNPGLRDCYQPPLRLPSGDVRDWVVPTAERKGLIGEAKTKYPGVTITDYWGGIRQAVMRERLRRLWDTTTDFGDWYDLQAGRFGWQPGQPKSPYYYMAAMALYASGRAVLYDTPPTEYAGRVMAPAFQAATDVLGVKPLVTNVLNPGVPDWVDLRFLNKEQERRLLAEGQIKG
jgi:hypothetical protein